jgi:hypothetical protein
MASTYVDGVRLDYVRRCRCGRKPEIATCYRGDDPGEGPFIISCFCGRPEDVKDEHGLLPCPRFCRSWTKSRAVALWRGMNVAQDTTSALTTSAEAR